MTKLSWPHLRYSSWVLQVRKNNSIKIAGVPAEMLTGYIPNTSRRSVCDEWPFRKSCWQILCQYFKSTTASIHIQNTHVISGPNSCYSTPFDDDDIVLLTFHYILPRLLLCNIKLSAVHIFTHSYAASLNKLTLRLPD